jgi:TatD DNase family protein
VTDKTFYICGPNVMVDFCLATLAELGVPRHGIKRELYGPPADVTKEPGWPENLSGDAVFEVERVAGYRWGGHMLIDAHAHLDRYGDELAAVLEEIEQHRIFTVSSSMDLASYGRNLEIGEICEFVLPTFGVHPWNAREHAGSLGNLSKAARESPILSEIGLDHHFVTDVSQYPAQREVFEFFLAAARDQEKIVVLHTTGAESEILELLDRYDIQRGIVHWYSGPLDVFHELVARRAYFTIGVEVLYSEHIQAIARKLPSDLLLTETDNPGGPRSLTGVLGMPRLILDVVQALAELRATTAQAIVQTVQNNFVRLIADDLWLSQIHTTFFGE